MPERNRAWVDSEDQITQVSDFIFWTAWLSSTLRPGDDITYTNNWPYDEDAGNTMSFAAVWWSGASVTILILFVGIILFVFYRYKLGMKEAYQEGAFPVFDLDKQPLTASQVKTGKYFAVVSLLFLFRRCSGLCSPTIILNRTAFWD